MSPTLPHLSREGLQSCNIVHVNHQATDRIKERHALTTVLHLMFIITFLMPSYRGQGKRLSLSHTRNEDCLLHRSHEDMKTAAGKKMTSET
jgi:hypothetical protein